MVYLLHFLNSKQSDLFCWLCQRVIQPHRNVLRADSRQDKLNWPAFKDSARNNSRMDSTRLVVFLSLWLILNSVLFNQVESFEGRPRRRRRKKGRGKRADDIVFPSNVSEDLGVASAWVSNWFVVVVVFKISRTFFFKTDWCLRKRRIWFLY